MTPKAATCIVPTSSSQLFERICGETSISGLLEIIVVSNTMGHKSTFSLYIICPVCVIVSVIPLGCDKAFGTPSQTYLDESHLSPIRNPLDYNRGKQSKELRISCEKFRTLASFRKRKAPATLRLW